MCASRQPGLPGVCICEAALLRSLDGSADRSMSALSADVYHPPFPFSGLYSIGPASAVETVLTSSIMLSFRPPAIDAAAARQESSFKCPN